MVSDKIKYLFWEALFWVAIGTLFLWALGKSFGIINSPNWVEMLPYFSIGTAISAASIKIGRILEKIENIDKRLTNLTLTVIEIGKDVREIQRKAFCLNDSRCPNKA